MTVNPLSTRQHSIKRPLKGGQARHRNGANLLWFGLDLDLGLGHCLGHGLGLGHVHGQGLCHVHGQGLLNVLWVISIEYLISFLVTLMCATPRPPPLLNPSGARYSLFLGLYLTHFLSMQYVVHNQRLLELYSVQYVLTFHLWVGLKILYGSISRAEAGGLGPNDG